MDSTENRDGNEYVNVAENVVGTTAGVVYMKLLEFFDAMIVLIGVVNCSTNQPFLKIWKWQNSLYQFRSQMCNTYMDHTELLDKEDEGIRNKNM